MSNNGGFNITDKSIKKLSEEELHVLWLEFSKDKTSKILKEKLIIQYIYLIKYVVGRLRVGLPASIATEDITSYGIEGLMNAVERFELDKNVRFETYALTRIRGTIIDKIRNQDWVPRSLRRKQKEVKIAIEMLQKEIGRKPTVDEIAAKLNTTKDKIESILNELDYSGVVSLYEKRDSSGEGQQIIDTIEDGKSKTPEEQLEEKDVKKELSQALKRLPERERMLLTLYYHENMTLKEIGEAINVSESRVCQLHAQAIMKLRNLLTTKEMSRRRIIV